MSDTPAVKVSLTDAQRAFLTPYAADVRRHEADLALAQAMLNAAFTGLVAGTGVDPATHRARLALDLSGFDVAPRELVS